MSDIIKKQFSNEEITLLKNTICPPSTTDSELKVFLAVCERKRLDPFQKQIYLTKRFDKRQGKEVMTIISSIDGYRAIASRSDVYAGCDDIVFDSEERPRKATCTVYKIVKGIRCPFVATVRWMQFVPPAGSDFMWQKMPNVMLGKVAEAHALRKAFPEDLSGIYIEDEMQGDSEVVTVEAANPEPKTIKAIESKDDETKTWITTIADLMLGKYSPFHNNKEAAANYVKEKTGKMLKDLNASELEQLHSDFMSEFYPSDEAKDQLELLS